MTNLSTQPVKGFRDLYPADRSVQNYLFETMKSVVTTYGYDEYEGPILESMDLYAAKSGEELVKEQTFLLKDRGERMLAMRPELTPSLARMVAKKRFDIPVPVRWFSIGPRFRYEAPQKGRGREFYQMDVDLLCSRSPLADAEILEIAITFLQKLGLTPDDIVVKVNNRRLLEKQITGAGIESEKLAETIRFIDRKDKLSEDQWKKMISEKGYSDEQIQSLLNILNNFEAWNDSDELSETITMLDTAGLKDYIMYDPATVRGLDYYTGTVFEVRDRAGKFRAILGGGRYDNLVELFDTEPLSGIGFACGDMVLIELLTELNKLPVDRMKPSTQVLVTVFTPDQSDASNTVAQTLRNASIITELYPSVEVKLDKQLKYADKKQIPYVIIIGPDEFEKKEVVLKNMNTNEQQTIQRDKLVEEVTSLMSA